MNIYLKLQTSVNLIFSNKKINEKNDLKLAPKPKLKKVKNKNKNKKQVIKEKCEDKLNIFNNIDNII